MKINKMKIKIRVHALSRDLSVYTEKVKSV